MEPVTQTPIPAKAFIDTGTLELSLSFTAVASALAAAQSEFRPVEKNRRAIVTPKDGGRGYTFDYADLASVLSAVTPALTKHGLAILQPPTNDGGIVRVQTWLIHGASGEWIRTKPLALEGGREQKQLGIATTYLRRYQVSALLAIAPEDDVDDGYESEPRDESRSAPPPANGSGRFQCAHGCKHNTAAEAKSCPGPAGTDRTLEPGHDPDAMSGPAGTDRTLEPGHDPDAMSGPPAAAPGFTDIQPTGDRFAPLRKALARKDWRAASAAIGSIPKNLPERKEAERQYDDARRAAAAQKAVPA